LALLTNPVNYKIGYHGSTVKEKPLPGDLSRQGFNAPGSARTPGVFSR